MRSRLLPVLLALLAVAAAVVAVVPGLREPGATEPAPEPVTPVFSLRRVPEAVARTVAAGRLASDLDEVLARAPDATCLAVQDAGGRPIYARQLDTALIPASAMKIVTGAAALTRLGADSRYVTPVRAAGPPQDGVVGDLWLVGTGDPLLATADYAAVAGWLDTAKPATPIETLADRIVAAGVRQVGRVVGDESRYDTQRYLPSWAEHYRLDDIGPQSALNVNGGLVQWQPSSVAAPAPAANAAAVLARLLRDRGVTVGGTGEGKAPDGGVVVAQVESPPLTEIVGAMLTHSDNLAAELLVKELGVRFGGGGTTAAGLGVVRIVAAELGLPVDAYAGVDGSGLDRGDRLSCGLLQNILDRTGPDGPIARGLPVAGTSGTLLRRFLGTAAVGRVRAKTGSLSGVTALTGWAAGTDGSQLEFAMLANDVSSEAAGMGLQERLANVLVRYPEGPSVEDVDPEPARPAPG